MKVVSKNLPNHMYKVKKYYSEGDGPPPRNPFPSPTDNITLVDPHLILTIRALPTIITSRAVSHGIPVEDLTGLRNSIVQCFQEQNYRLHAWYTFNVFTKFQLKVVCTQKHRGIPFGFSGVLFEIQ